MAGNTFKAFDGTEQHFDTAAGDGSSGTPWIPTTTALASDGTEPLGAPSDAAYAGSGDAGIIGILKGVYARLAAGLPASLGGKTKSGSLSVTIATDEDNIVVEVHGSGGAEPLGQTSDAAYAGSGNAGIIGILKGVYALLTDLATIDTNIAALDTTTGSTLDAAVVTDTSGTISGKVRGLVKWAFERMPTSLGEKTKAASLAVVPASDWDLPDTAAGDLASAAADLASLAAALSGTTLQILQRPQTLTMAHTAVNATTTSGVALASNAKREYAEFVNDSDSVLYLKLGAAAVAHEGIRLEARGGKWVTSVAQGNLYTGNIYVIHADTGNKVLLMTQGVAP